MSIASVMPSNHLILRCPLLLLPSIFPSIRVPLPVVISSVQFSHSVVSDSIPTNLTLSFCCRKTNHLPLLRCQETAVIQSCRDPERASSLPSSFSALHRIVQIKELKLGVLSRFMLTGRELGPKTWALCLPASRPFQPPS